MISRYIVFMIKIMIEQSLCTSIKKPLYKRQSISNFQEGIMRHLLTKHSKAVNDHFCKFFLNSEIKVFHELESRDFHLDVYIIKPIADRNMNYTILMTNGMSSVPLTTPQEDCAKYIELCMLLPPGWFSKSDDWNKLEKIWPVGYLKNIARCLAKNNTWSGFGHTIKAPEPMIGSMYVSSMLIKSKTLPHDFQKINCGNNTIEVFTLFPLYLEELKYKFENGTDPLLALLIKEYVSDILNKKRINVCKQKRKGA